jgi:hypothetical protein
MESQYDDTGELDRRIGGQMGDEQAMNGYEQELRWVPYELRSNDPKTFDSLSRRARKSLMEFDGWMGLIATKGIGPARPRIDQCDLALIQGIRPVQHLMEFPYSMARVLDVQADDINIQEYAATNPQWRTEPLWHGSQRQESRCPHQCEQQDCRSASNCEWYCCFSSNHKIPHLCSIHWGLLIDELDGDVDENSPSQASDDDATDDSSDTGVPLTEEAMGKPCHMCLSLPSQFLCSTCGRRACTDCCYTVSATQDVELPECDSCAEVRRRTFWAQTRGPVGSRARWIEDF